LGRRGAPWAAGLTSRHRRRGASLGACSRYGPEGIASAKRRGAARKSAERVEYRRLEVWGDTV